MSVFMTEFDQLETFLGLPRLGHRRTQQKAYLKELARRGENWALQELEDLRRAERAKNKAAYVRFKAKRRPEVLRAKWRTAKATQRAAAAAAQAEAEERKRRDEEVAAKAAALAAEAERERKTRQPVTNSGNEVELEILRIPPNPRMVICRYSVFGEERQCVVDVRRNSSFVPRMRFRLQEPTDPTARSKPWPFAPNRLPRRRGRW
jgi:hypothetical protein